MPWLPADCAHPTWVAVGEGFHLRPITAADTDLDYPAVMGSQERLWSIYGRAWGWPPATMTYQQDRDDLARHEAETAAHLSFNYALFDNAEQPCSAASTSTRRKSRAPTPRSPGG
jgi:hypothetical protein